jgi:hypothetical protein
MHRAILAAALAAAGLQAQGTGPFKNGDYLILCGYSDSNGPGGSAGNSFPVSRFKDLDGDGRIDDTAELFAFLRTSYNTRNSTGSFMSDMDWVQEGDNYAFYLADSGDGRITRGVDLDNDGLLGPNEVTQFFDFQSGFSPDGIAVWRAPGSNRTIVYVAQDDSGSPFPRGIHRLVDLNGDGDATDAGEHSVFVSAASNLTVPGRNGPVALVSHFWEQVDVLGDGTVVAFSRGTSNPNTANNPDQFCWYAFTDNNGTPSASVFFNPSQANAIPTHPDFDATGSFPQWEVTVRDAATSATKTYNDVQFFAQQAPDGSGVRDAYFTATYNIGGNFANPQGVNVHGLFYRWRDADGDFRIGAGEISLFANFSNATVAGVPNFQLNTPSTTFIEQGGPIFALKAADDQLHLTYGIGGAGAPNKGVMLLEDLDGDGRIQTAEARLSYQFSGATTSVYSASFGPFVKDASAFDRGLMPGPFPAGLTPYGQGCPDPNTGLSPVCDIYGGAPRIDNPAFGLAASRLAPGSSSVYLFVGFGRTSLPIVPPFGRPGCNLLTNPIDGFGAFTAANDGVAALALPIPNDPNLINGMVNVQWANLVTQGSLGLLVMSNGIEITIQP